jgi:hypothetical protein
LLAADELPRYGPDALDMLADEVFLLASHLDPRGSRARREGYVRRALGMYERIIRDHPGFLPAYEDKARIYDRRARNLVDEGDTACTAGTSTTIGTGTTTSR